MIVCFEILPLEFPLFASKQMADKKICIARLHAIWSIPPRSAWITYRLVCNSFSSCFQATQREVHTTGDTHRNSFLDDDVGFSL